MVFTGTSATGSLVVPEESLEPGNTYFARVILTVDGVTMTSGVVRFSVAHAAAHFAIPIDGGELYKDQHVTLKPQAWATSYVIEVSPSETTWARNRFIETLKNGQYATTLTAGEMKVNGKLMEDGVTYYARSRTSYLDFDGNSHNTAYGPIISFVYRDRPSQSGDVNGDDEINIADINAVIDMILSGTASGRGDVNGDGETNIADVNALIDFVLSD